MTSEERRKVVIKALRKGNVPMKPAVVAEIIDAWEDDIATTWNDAVEAGRMAETIPLWI